MPTPIATNGSSLTFDWDITTDTAAEGDKISAVADACIPESIEAVGRVWVSQGDKLD